MKRIDKEPNRTELIDLVVKDPIKRDASLVDFMEMLMGTEPPFTYFLDGDWGSGKTIFARQLMILMEWLSGAADAAPDEALAKLNTVDSIKELRQQVVVDDETVSSLGFLPVYYNAWENDHWQDPLPSLISTIAWAINADGKVTRRLTEEDAVFGVLKSIMQRLQIDNGIPATDEPGFLRDIQNRLMLRRKIKELVTGVLAEDNGGKSRTLVLIIDELDRCRPSFAVELLEQVKTLFDHDNLIAIYSVNAKQLAKTVEGCYGAGFDGDRYLNRFYDHSYPLHLDANCDYLTYLGLSNQYGGRIYGTATDIAEALSMSLRERNRFYEALQNARKFSYNGSATSVFTGEQVIATILIALRLSKPNLFWKITSEFDADALYKVISNCPTILHYLDYLLSNYTTESFDDLGADELNYYRREILSDYLVLIFDNDSDSERVRNARRLLANELGPIGRLPHIRKMILS